VGYASGPTDIAREEHHETAGIEGRRMYIEFDIPNVEQRSTLLEYWVKATMIGSPSHRYQINALTSTYIRLVESCLVEYESGAARLREFWNTHTSFNLTAMNRSICHFEVCVTNACRAIHCYRRLRNDRERDPIALHLSADRPSFISDAVAKRFVEIRNQIQHLENAVVNGEIEEGQPFMLAPSGREVAHPIEAHQTIKTIDRLVIGKTELPFSELAALLHELHEFALSISNFLPSSTKREPEDHR